MFGRPRPVLRSKVLRYCGYVEPAGSGATRVQLASGVVGLVIGFGAPVDVAYPCHPKGNSTAQVASFVAGLHSVYAVVESPEPQHGVQIDLTPLGAHMLLGVPMDALADRVVELDSVLGRFAARLAERLHEAASWQARFEVLDATFASRLAGAREPSPTITWAWRRLTETSGRLGIAALADELGASRQYLVTHFREEIGVTPKLLARILRFQNAVSLLEADKEASLARIAQSSGYHDQAHLNRDFRQFAGSTPTEFLARPMPDGTGLTRD